MKKINTLMMRSCRVEDVRREYILLDEVYRSSVITIVAKAITAIAPIAARFNQRNRSQENAGETLKIQFLGASSHE